MLVEEEEEGKARRVVIHGIWIAGGGCGMGRNAGKEGGRGKTAAAGVRG